MRLFLSALLLVATFSTATAVRAQQHVPQQGSAQAGAAVMENSLGNPGAPQAVPLKNAGCPVTLTSARLNWPASYLPTDSAEKVPEPNLALGFLNSSGRAIRSAGVTAELRVKKDLYALDATRIEVQLSFAGTKDLDKELSQLATIPLPRGLHEYGVAQVRLDQVIFSDGSVWKAPAGANSCEVRSFGLVVTK